MTAFDQEFLQACRLISPRARQLRASRPGRLRASRLGGGTELTGWRDYSPGDDLRRVDWRVCSRHDELVVREYHARPAENVHVLIDCSASMGGREPSKLALACQTAAAIAMTARALGDAVWLGACCDTITGEVGPVRAQNIRAGDLPPTVRSFLEALEPLDRANRWRSVVEAFARREQPPGPVVLLSDWYDVDGLARLLEPLRQRGYRPAVFHIDDPADAEPPSLGDATLVDIETGATWHATIDESLADAYRREVDQHRRAVRRDCLTRGVPCTRLAGVLSTSSVVSRALALVEFLG